MTRKTWIWIGAAILLAGLSLYLNKDWFAKDSIQIYHRSRPMAGLFRRKKPEAASVNPIIFGFDRKLKLTSIKVVPMSDILTNKYPHPIWAMTSESNSAPVKDFMYGSPIPGMHPTVKGAQAEELAPGENYRLFVETSTFKGQHDFSPVAKTP